MTTFFSLLTLIALSQCIDDCMGDETRFGEGAGFNNTAPQVSIFGRSAGLNNTGDLGSFFGFNAGRNNTGFENSFFGHRSGIANTSGSFNAFFGSQSGHVSTSGNLNSFFGTNTGFENVTGSANAMFGAQVGYRNTSGSNNAFFGTSAGFANTTGIRNVFLGTAAGVNNRTGSFNIAIGNSAGPEGLNDDIDSTLYIDVYPTDEPLIYGHFDQRVVRINGEFEAMGGTANGSDINLKNEIIPVEEKDILEKLAAIEISEWAYKDQAGVRHIGPMAQDFYKAFGLGNSDKTINTIDADGVSLVAIQALYDLLKIEKERNDALEKKLHLLTQSINTLQRKNE